MNQQTIKIGKKIVSAVWVLCLISIIQPQIVSYSGVFQGIAVFLVVSHLIEIFIYRARFNNALDYVQTFLFGLLHLKALAHQHKQQKQTIQE